MLSILRSPLLHPLNERQAWSALLGALNPRWSLTEARAQVLSVVVETPTVSSFWLRPNGAFKGFKAGQHVLVGLELNGVREFRAFSFSSAPDADKSFRITVQRQPHGRVTAALHQLKPGDWVHLGQASGDYSPSSQTAPLLLIAAGSGMTPMLGLLAQIARSGIDRDVVLLQCVRQRAGLIGDAELAVRSASIPGLRRLVHVSETHGRIDSESLDTLVPDWQRRETLLCGPASFARSFERAFERRGLLGQLKIERFGSLLPTIDESAPVLPVVFTSSVQSFTAAAGQSLLAAAEAVGLQPRFGCRRGICKTCQCRKQSGIVKNLHTGEISGAGDEWISLCISTPLSRVEISA